MEKTRRTFIKEAAMLSSASVLAGQGIIRSAGAQTPDYRRIAVEEIYCPPEVMEASIRAINANPDLEPNFLGNFSPDNARFVNGRIIERLQDIGEERLRVMDESGIDKVLLSNWAPGVQLFETEEAKELAAISNDRMAEAARAHPDRYAGMVTIAPQDPEAAGVEIERGLSLGLTGVLINSHTHDEYLDDPKFWPIFEVCEARSVPIYLHPRVPAPQMYAPFSRYNMHGAMWGFAIEASTHALRLIGAGVFDQFPNLTLVLGHMGEGLPFWLYRLDTTSAAYVGSTFSRPPSEYVRENMLITTSGMAWDPALLLSHAALGAENIMFAVDYPFGNYARDTAWFDAIDLPEADKRLIYSGNAERIYNLS